MNKGSHISNLLTIYNQLIARLNAQECEQSCQMHDLLSYIRQCILTDNEPSAPVDTFSFDQDLVQQLGLFEQKIQQQVNSKLFSAISYFVSEIVCNMEQHSGQLKGYGCFEIDKENSALRIALIDGGRGIYGSYAMSGKYIDKLGNSDSQALYLAQNGYSTKNLPNAENRGYGISSNVKLIVDGLNGAFSILSGNALYISDALGKTIIELPDEIDWVGTLVMIEVPLECKTFNLYDYIS